MIDLKMLYILILGIFLSVLYYEEELKKYNWFVVFSKYLFVKVFLFSKEE